MSNTKKSLIAGGLLSSAGILVSKILGILYVVPFQALVGPNNMQYYSYAFDIYTYILNISIAGLPFAIATMVSMYASKGDYRTTLLIKRISLGIMMMLGFIGMSFVILFSGPLARIITPSNVSAESLQITQNVLVIISLALFFVPVLSSYRGFYQGYKEMSIYANNQVLEQLSRIVFLLSLGAIAVLVFKTDRIWAVYFAVLATSVSAIFALLQFIIYDRKKIKSIKTLAQRQEQKTISKKKIIRELVKLAVPFLLVSMLGEIYRLVDLVTLNKNLELYGYTAQTSEIIFGIYKFNVAKLTSIPMIFAQGFSIAIIPYITEAIALRHYDEVKKSIVDVFDSVLYLVLPLAFALFLFATPIFFIMYGAGEEVLLLNDVVSTTSQLGGNVLAWAALEAFIGTVAPIISYLMMSLKMPKLNLRILIIGALTKIVLTVPMIRLFGYQGAILSTFIAIALTATIGVIAIKKRYKVNLKRTYARILQMSLGLAGMALVALFFGFIGFDVIAAGRGLGFIQLGIMGVTSIIVYFMITAYFKLPQKILNLPLDEMVGKIVRRIRK